MKTLGAEFFFERKKEFQNARNSEKVDEKEREAEQLKRRDQLRNAAVRREMGFWKYYCCWSKREAVLAKILPDLEPPPKKKENIKKKMSSSNRKKSSSSKRRKIKIRTKDDKYLEKSEKRREERRKSREAMGRTRSSKRNKVSKEILSEPSKRDSDHYKLKKRPSSRRGSSKKKKTKKKSMRGPASRVM